MGQNIKKVCTVLIAVLTDHRSSSPTNNHGDKSASTKLTLPQLQEMFSLPLTTKLDFGYEHVDIVQKRRRLSPTTLTIMTGYSHRYVEERLFVSSVALYGEQEI